MLYRCRICGGNIATDGKMTVGTCDSCGTMQTVPRLDDERRAQMYERANHYIRKAEYDKAMSLFEQILDEDKTDAEAYWSLVLCKYGVEYVLDPKSGMRTPTCNRAQFQSVLSDLDYQGAQKYANDSTRMLYQTQALEIANIQKRILDISSKEKPYDVFISYKDKDVNGDRTLDSVIAQELYDELLKAGMHVFFARITLEDKVGLEYEPFIFAALNSAKVMIVVGTNAQNFHAPWVKNEWSRYLKLMAMRSGLHLIPAFRNMDAYDIPEEFLHFQAVDLGKIGAIQDVVRGTKKLIEGATKKDKSSEAIISEDRYLERGTIYLQSNEWTQATEYFSRHLDNYPKDYRGWWNTVAAKTHNFTELKCFSDDILADYKKALQFAPDEMKASMRQQFDVVLQKMEKQADLKVSSANNKVNQLRDRVNNLKSKAEGNSSEANHADGVADDLEKEKMAINAKLLRGKGKKEFPKVLLGGTGCVTTFIIVGIILDLVFSENKGKLSEGGLEATLIPVALIVICIIVKMIQNNNNKAIDRDEACMEKLSKQAEENRQKAATFRQNARKLQINVSEIEMELQHENEELRDLSGQLGWYKSLQQ